MLQEMALFIFFVCQLYSANKPDFHDEIDITPVINVEAGIEELKRSFGEFFPKLSFSEKFPKQQNEACPVLKKLLIRTCHLTIEIMHESK